jgi:hypothetical protein
MKPRLAVKGRTKKGIRAMEKREPKLVSFHVAFGPSHLATACLLICLEALQLLAPRLCSVGYPFLSKYTGCVSGDFIQFCLGRHAF